MRVRSRIAAFVPRRHPVGGCDTFFDLTDEPFVVADESLDSLTNESFAVLPLLRCDSIQLSFEFGWETNLHRPILAGTVSLFEAGIPT